MPSVLWRLIHSSMSAREKRQVPPTLKAGIFLAPARWSLVRSVTFRYSATA